MQKTAFSLVFWGFMASSALAAPASLTVSLTGIENGKPIPAQYAFCQPDGKGKYTDAPNVNPEIRWAGAPAGTKSFVILVVDPDVPAQFDDANKDGKTIAADFPRKDFIHWALADIPANMANIAEGADSKGKQEGGKPVGKTAYGINGKNDFGLFVQGTFGGYDGPCPPWNDARLHHYYFRVYALDVATLGLKDGFNGKELDAALQGHVLAQGEAMGTYTNNAALLAVH